jgi:homoserine dehydrogenase
VAVANKKPLCADYDTFARLTAHPRGHIAYEATVGAGLPLIHTLRTLIDAGDELVDMTACLSGTLGYLCSELEDGRPLSQVVPEARARGFTEPDPRDDLSGADVRRKALILARTMNQHLELEDVPGAPLIRLEEGDVEQWLAGLARHDVTLATRVRSAREQGDVLRYVARILPGKCEVGLRAVPRLSAVGRLRGTDNILTVHTRFYGERPLVISGPGAGPDVTAAGVFGDLLRLACIA